MLTEKELDYISRGLCALIRDAGERRALYPREYLTGGFLPRLFYRPGAADKLRRGAAISPAMIDGARDPRARSTCSSFPGPVLQFSPGMI